MKKSLFAAIYDPLFLSLPLSLIALQNLGQDAPRTDWDKMSQLREEVPRRMRGTAGGTPAHPYEEAVSSLSLITNNQ
jgi:hypothetical protein